MIQRILCPTDLTINSKHGVAYAFSLARRNGTQLIVFHATSFPTLSPYPCCELEPYYQWDQFVSKFKMDHVLAEGECKVRNFVCEKFGVESSGVAWNPRVALGRVAEEIVVAALQEEVDLIILARRKGRTLTRLFTRSISESVLRVETPKAIRSLECSKVGSLFWHVQMSCRRGR